MANSTPSALITDQGARVLLRLDGHIFNLTQPELRQILGLPEGPLGLGITIDRDRLQFDFPTDNRSFTITAAQLRKRLVKMSATTVSTHG